MTLPSVTGIPTCRLPPDCQLQSCDLITAKPIFFYRPAACQGTPMLRLTLDQADNTKKTGAAVAKVIDGNSLTAASGFRFQGHAEVYEHETKPFMKFMVDTGLAAGAWLFLPSQAWLQSDCGKRYMELKSDQVTLKPLVSSERSDAHQAVTHLPSEQRLSTCDMELLCPYTALDSLTPDATQLADPHWQPALLQAVNAADLSPPLQHSLGLATRGDIAGMTVLSLDVLLAPRDGSNR